MSRISTIFVLVGTSLTALLILWIWWPAGLTFQSVGVVGLMLVALIVNAYILVGDRVESRLRANREVKDAK